MSPPFIFVIHGDITQAWSPSEFVRCFPFFRTPSEPIGRSLLWLFERPEQICCCISIVVRVQAVLSNCGRNSQPLFVTFGQSSPLRMSHLVDLLFIISRLIAPY